MDTGAWILESMKEKKVVKSPGPWWLVALIALWITCFVLMATASYAMEASWYSVDSLIKEGTASYNPKHIMANGEVFEDGKMVAASRDYKLNQKVRVSLKDGSKSVIVKVTDRTNKRFAGKRIDLSKRAFEVLSGGRLDKGILPVIVEVV